MEIVYGVTVEIIKQRIQNYIVDPIKRHVSYAFKWKANVKKLQQQAEQLKNEKERLQISVDGAKRQGHQIFPNVSTWLTKADAALLEVQPLIDDDELKEKKRCFMGLVPNLKTRYQVSKKAYRKGVPITELLNEHGLEPASYPLPPKQMVAPSVYAGEGLPSRLSIFKEVMVALQDPNVNTIGVFGMGGVGKTTLAKEVHRQAQADKMFDHVIFVAVSQVPEIIKIQSEIAEVLGLSLKATVISVRANELFERFKKEKEVLIILDDMWNLLKLHEVGIPFVDDHKGCKIFVTSRRRDVCSDMGAQKIFPINFLSEEESWSLFKKNLPQVEDNEFQALAIDINKKCAGLPLLIEIVAKDLQRRKEVHAWQNKLKQLSHFVDLDKTVSLVLTSSYDNLENEEAKAFFLLCGLFGQSNIRVEYLVRYCAGLNLFRSLTTIKDIRNRILTFIDDLKAESLLLDGDMVGFVKMHDLVRDTACILSEEQRVFIGMAGAELNKRPDRECTRISLPYCEVNGTLESMDCPNAELLLLSTKDSSLKIPDSFFNEIKKLKVLDFSGLMFVSLPSSLSSLINLQTLCLHQCELGDIAIIGELKQLRVLSLVGSTNVDLPKEIELLAQLKSLDLTDCSIIKFIPANMLSKLRLLEELYLKKCCILQGAEGDQILKELSSLSHLRSLEIQLANDIMIPKALAERLQSYKILIGEDLDWNQLHQDSLSVVKLYTSIDVEHGDGVKLLLQKAEEVYLKGVLPYLLDGDGFPQLKHLKVSSSHELPRLINSTTTKPMFPKLENLYIYDLEHLEEFFHGQLAIGSFKELRTLKVEKCPRLKHLFSVSIAKSLLQLKKLNVDDCAKMEEVIIRESGENNEIVEFAQLRSLKLKNLPQLRSFCSDEGEFVSNATSSLFSKMVVFSNLKSISLWKLENLNNIWHNETTLNSFFELKTLHITKCGRLTKIFPSHVIQRFQNLRKLKVEDCDMVEVIFEIEEGNNVSSGAPTAFELRGLEIEKMRSLKQIWSNDPKEAFTFQNLQSVFVWRCYSLKYVFPAARDLVNLEILEISGSSVEEIVGKAEEAEGGVRGGEGPCFNLPKLSKLSLRWLPEMRSFYGGTYFVKLPILKDVVVTECPQINILFGLSNVDDDDHHKSRPLFFVDKHLEKNYHGELADGSLKALRFLTIFDCQRLKHLFSISIARSLPQLEGLHVHNCFEMKEIIARGCKEENEVVEFTQLRSLELSSLPQLISFCNDKGEFVSDAATSLFNKMVSFPNLESLKLRYLHKLNNIWRAEITPNSFYKLKILTVENCKKLSRIFPSHVIQRFQKLQNLWVTNCHSMEEIFEIEGGNNNVSFPNLEFLVLKYLDKLNNIWHAEITPNSFCKLKALDIAGCGSLSRIFPSHTIQIFQKLHNLCVTSCDSVEEIFEIEGGNNNVSVGTPTPFELRDLKIWSMKSLKQIWSKNLKGAFNFQNLQSIQVCRCNSLKYIFPASIAVRDLSNLEKLNIEYSSIEEIVEMAGEGGGGEDPCFNFPKLTLLSLLGLEKITSFYPERHSVKMPILKKIEVKECSNKIVQFGQSNYKFLDKARPLLFLDKVSFPSLEHMNIRNINELEYFSSGEFSIERFPQLKSILELTSDYEGQQLASGFLQTLYSLSIQTLAVKDSRLGEVLFSNEGVLNDTFVLPVKELTLLKLFNLKHIWKEDSQLKSLFKHLQSLDITACRELINIAPSSSSFENLAILTVCDCTGLRSLITTSIAKTMVQLQKMEVTRCENITEIVANDAEENDAIIFSKLTSLYLSDLPKLTSFCSANYSFNFPCFEQVQLIKCSQMKTFCSGDVNTPKLREIKERYSLYSDTKRSHWKGSTNATIAYINTRD